MRAWVLRDFGVECDRGRVFGCDRGLDCDRDLTSPMQRTLEHRCTAGAECKVIDAADRGRYAAAILR